VVGVTATPDRADGIGLGHVFEEIVFERDLVSMIQAGYLCDIRAEQIRLRADFGRVGVRGGDFSEGELGSTLLAANAPAQAVEAYQRHARGRKGLVFTPTVALADAMADAFASAGIPAEAVNGDTPVDQRRAALARFSMGETPILANCGVYTEGFDEPSIDLIVIGRPTKSRPLYTQMIGRGTRLYPGKTDCLVLDLVGATAHDLVTTASLVGLPPTGAIRHSLRAAIAEQQAIELPTPIGELVSRPVDLFKQRPFTWVQVSERFVLSCGKHFLSLEPSRGAWDVYRVVDGEDRPRETLLRHSLPLGYAQGFAEDEARRLGKLIILDPQAPWRRDPASARQLELLARLGVPSTAELTKGEASELITAAKMSRTGR
jgi:hypothetical protein